MTEKPLTLGEFNKRILTDAATALYMANAMMRDLERSNALADLLAKGYKPPTRWQRFKHRLQDIGRRAKNIWTILSGGDIHENCG